jgi:hypothetical protein
MDEATLRMVMNRIVVSTFLTFLLLIVAPLLFLGETKSMTIVVDQKSGSLESLVAKNYSGSMHISLDIEERSDWRSWYSGWDIPSSFDDRSDMAAIMGRNEVLYYQSYYDPPSWQYRYYILNLTSRNWFIVGSGVPDEQYLDYDFASVYGSAKILIMKTMTQGKGLNFSLFDGEHRSEKVMDRPMQDKYGPRTDGNIVPIANASKVLFWGGRTGIYPDYTIRDDTWVFDLKTGSWTEIFPENVPPPRFYHALSPIWGTDKVLMFGGVNATMVNETWIFDLSEERWTLLQNITNPTACTYADMAPLPHTGRVILYGGYDGTDKLNSTYEFDSISMSWEKADPKTPLPPQAKHFMAEDEEHDGIVMWGLSNDLYRYYVYEPANHYPKGNYTMSPVKLGPSAILKRITWEGAIPEGTSIGFKVRFGYNTEDLLKRPFSGPGKDDYYSSRITIMNTTPVDERFMQLLFTLSTDRPASSPVLDSVTIVWNTPPIAHPISPVGGISNLSTGFYWTYEDEDSDPQSKVEIVFIDLLNHTYVWDIQLAEDESIIDLHEIGQGIWSWRIRAMDSDGNWGPFSEWIGIHIDCTKPTSSIIYPDKDVIKDVDGIYGSANDRNGSVDRVMVLIQRGSDGSTYDGAKWVLGPIWIRAEGTTLWRVNCSLDDGIYNVRSRAVDIIGNVQEIDSEITFMVDSTPPNNLSVTINHGDENTTVQLVELSLSCGADTSGVEEMCFSLDGAKWGEWTRFNLTHILSLGSEYGEKKVYFKIRDRAGNEADPVFDTIMYNITAPTVDGENEGKDDDPYPWILAIPILVLMIVAFVVILSLLRQKSKDTIFE